MNTSAKLRHIARVLKTEHPIDRTLLSNLLTEAEQEIDRLAATEAKLREAVEILLVGACACAVPHPGERAVLQKSVDMARKILSETTKQ